MADILHRVKVWLYENVLTKDNLNDLIARVALERTLNVQEVCKSAVDRGGADISASAMAHAVELFHKEMAFLMGDAFRINTGYYLAGVSIRGSFESAGEHFTRGKHTLHFEFQQGELLRREIEAMDVDVLGMAASAIMIQQVTDVRTGSVNDHLTPGRVMRIAGTKIKLAGESDIIGVWFVAQADGQRIRVDMADIVTNHPSELTLTIPPELATGMYMLEICTQFGGNSKQLLKEPRTATFDKILTV